MKVFHKPAKIYCRITRRYGFEMARGISEQIMMAANELRLKGVKVRTVRHSACGYRTLLVFSNTSKAAQMLKEMK